jgi:hypothetical protein
MRTNPKTGLYSHDNPLFELAYSQDPVVMQYVDGFIIVWSRKKGGFDIGTNHRR